MEMSKLKIAFISTMHNAPWGGSEELWSQTALHLAKRSVVVKVCVKKWRRQHARIKALKHEGCEIHYKEDPAAHENPKIRGLRELYETTNWLKSFKPSLAVISCGCIFQNAYTLEACLRTKTPFAVIFHAAAEHLWPSDEEIAAWKRLYASAEKCFFISKKNYKLAEIQLAAPIKNAQIIRNPCNARRGSRISWPRTKRKYRLACVGRLDPFSKGQDLLFQVMAANKWRRRPLEITLFGTGRCGKALRALKKKYRLDNILFGGFLSNVNKLWRSYHGLILPSRYEGLPLAITEAMMCGRICIVTDVAGNAEFVRNGKSGFVADFPSIKELDRAMERAWKHRHKWRAMGREAAQSIRRLIPADPVGIFADEVLSLVKRH